jgi:hypothetical protein
MQGYIGTAHVPQGAPPPGASIASSLTPDAASAGAGFADGGSDLLALIAEARHHMQREEDPNRLFDAYPQSKPRAFHPIPDQRAGAFPGVPFASVSAFSFGLNDDLFPAFPRACELLEPDGTFCPDVSAPGVPLSATQTARLLALMRAAGDVPDAGGRPRVGRIFARCGDPSLAFVFFDAEHAPVGMLEVSLFCNSWSSTPSESGVVGTMRAPERGTMLGLCDELGLDECWQGEDRFEAARQALDAERPAAVESSAEVARQLQGVDLDGPLAAATPFERRALCASSLRARHWRSQGGVTIELPDGRRWNVVDYPTCVATFPACAARVRDALACDRWLTAEKAPSDGGTSAGSSVCAGLDRCLWLFRPASEKPAGR